MLKLVITMDNVLKNNKGYTLIELMVALVIFAFLLIMMLRGILFAYKISFDNLVKDEVVKIAQEELERLRNTPFDEIDSSCSPCNPLTTDNNCKVTRILRNTSVNFGKMITVNQSGDIKKILINICTIYQDFHGNDIEFKLSSNIVRKY